MFSCELSIKSELEVALFALKWIQFQKFTTSDVCVLFSTVRTSFFNINERKELDDKAKEMGLVVAF